MKQLRLTAMVLAMVWVQGCASAPKADAVPVVIGQQWQAAISQQQEAGQVVVRDQVAWSEIWGTLGRSGESPKIDFGKDMVVGLFMGQKPSAGYAVTITRVMRDEKAKHTTVYYREQSPAEGSVAGAVITSPYHVAVVPWTKDVAFVADVR